MEKLCSIKGSKLYFNGEELLKIESIEKIEVKTLPVRQAIKSQLLNSMATFMSGSLINGNEQCIVGLNIIQKDKKEIPAPAPAVQEIKQEEKKKEELAIVAISDESVLAPYLSMAWAPEPDLFIRTGGEQRISNFLLWQLAYSELYFTDELWPDFDAASLDRAFESFRFRERRFGRTSAQLG